MISHRMAVQVIDEPAHNGMILHPSQLKDKLFIVKMVTKKRGENDIRGVSVKAHIPVVRMHPLRITFRPSLPGDLQAMRILIDPGHLDFDSLSAAPAAQDTQVVAASATDLADPHPAPPPGQAPEPLDTDGMSAKPGIDEIQFAHIPFDIPEGNIVPIEQFLFMAAL